jgi:DNA-binding beta-propeller fold protein YncE
MGERGFDPHQQENADEFTIDWRHKRFVWADNNNYRASSHNMHPGHFTSRILTEYDFPEALVVQPAWIVGGAQGGEPGTEFDEPNELGFDASGNLWAGDVFNFRVQIFDSTGAFIAAVGGEGNGPCQFVSPGSGKYGPEAIRLGSANRMFVVDRGGRKINIYDAGNFSCIGQIVSPLFDDPTGLAIDSAGYLYVADQGTDLVHQFTDSGVFVRTFQATDDGESILAKTETLALDEARDRLFASSEDESRVEVFELSTGNYLDEHVGERQVGVVAQDGRFADDVEGVATELVEDWLLLSDEDNGRFMIQDLGSGDLFDGDENYAFLGAFGKVGNAPGEFLSADGVAVSENLGLVAVADQGNYRIQVFRIADIQTVLGL